MRLVEHGLETVQDDRVHRPLLRRNGASEGFEERDDVIPRDVGTDLLGENRRKGLAVLAVHGENIQSDSIESWYYLATHLSLSGMAVSLTSCLGIGDWLRVNSPDAPPKVRMKRP